MLRREACGASPAPHKLLRAGGMAPTHRHRKGKHKEGYMACDGRGKTTAVTGYVLFLEMVGKQKPLLMQGWKDPLCQDAGLGLRTDTAQTRDRKHTLLIKLSPEL